MRQKAIEKLSLLAKQGLAYAFTLVGRSRRQIAFFFQNLQSPGECYHSESIPGRLEELSRICEKSGTAFWIFFKQVYVSFFADECAEGPLCIHYQIRARGIFGSILLRLFLPAIQKKLRQHSRRLLLYLELNAGNLQIDLAGFEHNSYASLCSRFLVLDKPPLLTESIFALLPGFVQKKRPVLFRPHWELAWNFQWNSQWKTKKRSDMKRPLRIWRFRRLLIQTWSTPANKLSGILPPPFHPLMAPSSDKEIVFYSITALEAGPLDKKTGRAKFAKGKEKNLVFFLLLPVFCLTGSERIDSHLLFRQIHFDTYTGKSVHEPLRARWNAYQDFLRFDIGDAKGQLIARTEFVADHPLGTGDDLPYFLSRPSFSITELDARSLELRISNYKLDFAINRIAVIESLPERELSKKTLRDFLQERLGISEIQAKESYLISYIDFLEARKYLLDIKEFQYRPFRATTFESLQGKAEPMYLSRKELSRSLA